MPSRPRHRRAEPPPFATPSVVLAGRGLQRGALRPLEIGLDDSGTIVALGRNVRGGRRYDLGESVLLPAAVDLHVHFRSPDAPVGGESWGRGTIQAALGGVGLAAEMPNGSPPANTRERVEERRDRGRGRLAIDLLLYGALELGSAVPRLASVAGAFKLYLAPTTGVEPPEDRGSVSTLLAAAAETGLPVSVHAEDPSRFHATESAADPVEWDRARPITAESSAVDEVLALAPAGLRLHIAHVTSVDVAARVRAAGHSFECTPHHLLLAARSGAGTWEKVNPPLREEPTRSQLFDLFARGDVPCLASDHAPHDRSEKERPFPLAPSGMPGVGTALPLMLERARAGAIRLDLLVSAAADRPARWLGLPMGRIALGHRTGILAVDFRRRERFSARRWPDSCGWSPFEGHEVVFPVEHWEGGERIVEAGEYTGRPTGTFRRPEYAGLPGPARPPPDE
jgi:dihydroorotase